MLNIDVEKVVWQCCGKSRSRADPGGWPLGDLGCLPGAYAARCASFRPDCGWERVSAVMLAVWCSRIQFCLFLYWVLEATCHLPSLCKAFAGVHSSFNVLTRVTYVGSSTTQLGAIGRY